MPYEHIDDDSRKIYCYSNGVRDIKADPTVIWRRINEECSRYDETWDSISEKWNQVIASENDTPDQAASKVVAFDDLQKTIAAIGYAALRLVPLDDDGDGVTENFVLKTLIDFFEYREKKGESIAITPSGSGPSDSDPTAITPPSSAATSTTSSTMDSPSTRASRTRRTAMPS